MPTFETMPVETNRRRRTTRGDTRKRLDAYIDFLNSLDSKHGGQAIIKPGENVITVQRNLKSAAELLSRKIVMRRSGNVISFYMADGRGRHGRRRASAHRSA